MLKRLFKFLDKHRPTDMQALIGGNLIAVVVLLVLNFFLPKEIIYLMGLPLGFVIGSFMTITINFCISMNSHRRDLDKWVAKMDSQFKSNLEEMLTGIVEKYRAQGIDINLNAESIQEITKH